jgi:hypothetical protein
MTQSTVRLASTTLTFSHASKFLTVDQQIRGQWKTILVDGDWDTEYVWTPHGSLSGVSTATINWNITEAIAPGTYRFVASRLLRLLKTGIASSILRPERSCMSHYSLLKNSSLSSDGAIVPFSGTSSSFQVL